MASTFLRRFGNLLGTNNANALFSNKRRQGYTLLEEENDTDTPISCDTCVIDNDGLVVGADIEMNTTNDLRTIVGTKAVLNSDAGSVVGTMCITKSNGNEVPGASVGLLFRNEGQRKAAVGALIDAGRYGQALYLANGTISIAHDVITGDRPVDIGPDSQHNDAPFNYQAKNNATYYLFAEDACSLYRFHSTDRPSGTIYTFYNSSDHDIDLEIVDDVANQILPCNTITIPSCSVRRYITFYGYGLPGKRPRVLFVSPA